MNLCNLVWRGLVAKTVLLVLLVCSTANSQGRVSIMDMTTITAPDYQIIFTLVDEEGHALPQYDLKQGDITLYFDGKIINLQTEGELTHFGKESVGLLWVFPYGEAYMENVYRIRKNVANMIERVAYQRPVDVVGVVAFDSEPLIFEPVTGQDMIGLAEQVSTLDDSRSTRSNFYETIPQSVMVAKSIKDVQLRFLIVISDGTSSDTDLETQPRQARGLASLFAKEGIIPFVVAYSTYSNQYFNNLKAISRAQGGGYTEAASPDDLPQAMERAYDYIYGTYLLTFSAPDLAEGNHTFTVEVSANGQTFEGHITLPVPRLRGQ